MQLDKVALGTVQFGLPYGVANQAGQVPPEDVAAILTRGRAVGIDTLDTAQAYGQAEAVLGRLGVSDFHLIGKVGRVQGDLRARVCASLETLGIERFSGLLLHEPDQILEQPGLADELEQLKQEGLTLKVGYSVYEPEQTARLIDCFTPDLVQLPLSPIDRRWDDSGVLSRRRQENVTIHVRSAYLQGLLLMPPEHRPDWTAPWKPLLDNWHDWVAGQCSTPAIAALTLAVRRSDVDKVVIGVNNCAQLEQIISSTATTLEDFPEDLQLTDPRLLDPRYWGK
jgi:aryl-alcohol dehydrogenase-like predicted oxidoreductase